MHQKHVSLADVVRHRVHAIKRDIHTLILARVVRIHQVHLVVAGHREPYLRSVVVERLPVLVINVRPVVQLINTVVAVPDIVEAVELLAEVNIPLVHVVVGIHGAEAVVLKIVPRVHLIIVRHVMCVMEIVVRMVHMIHVDLLVLL